MRNPRTPPTPLIDSNSQHNFNRLSGMVSLALLKLFACSIRSTSPPKQGSSPAAPRSTTLPPRIDFDDDLVGHSPTRLADVSSAATHVATDYLTEEHGPCSTTPAEQLPLLSETFRHSCLNRLQLRNPLTMVELGEQNGSLIYAGDIANPLAE